MAAPRFVIARFFIRAAAFSQTHSERALIKAGQKEEESVIITITIIMTTTTGESVG